MNALLAGSFADWPKLLSNRNGWRCPLCSRSWSNEGGGAGFVKAGARRHVAACWQETLRQQGLQMGDWDEGRQAHILVPLRATPKG